MIIKILDRISFIAIFLVVVLLPIFFVPVIELPLEVSKSFVAVFGTLVAIVAWIMARLFEGKIEIPRSRVIISVLGIVLVFLLSATFSPVVRMSLFGTMFDVGTFWFIFMCFGVLFVLANVSRKVVNSRIIIFGVVVVSSLVALYQIIHAIWPGATSMVIFPRNTDNLIGSWGSLSIFSALSALVSLYVAEFFNLSRKSKIILGVTFVLPLIMLVIINLTFSWLLLGAFALVIFILKVLSYSRERQVEGASPQFPAFSLGVVVLALLFLISANSLGGLISDKLGVKYVELRPNIDATVTVAKGTYKESIKNAVLGAGPNRFGAMWSMHKPINVNASQFWDTEFDFGWGLLLTFVITTGILGVLAWLVFFYFHITSGLRALFATIRDGSGPEKSLFFLVSLFLFVAAIIYPVGVVLIILAFAFTGIFVGLSVSSDPDKIIQISFAQDPKKSFLSIIILVALMITAVVSSLKFSERFVSAYYFGKTFTAQTQVEAQNSITRALSLNTNDLFLRTYAQVSLLKLGELIAQNAASPEPNPEIQRTFDEALNAVVQASSYNHLNPLNFRALGLVYDSVAPLGVEGAYEKAIESYKKASTLNPLNPGLKFLIAKDYFVTNQIAEAKLYATESFNLKPNYLDALLLLSQIAKTEGDKLLALNLAQQAQILAPESKEITQYVNSLK